MAFDESTLDTSRSPWRHTFDDSDEEDEAVYCGNNLFYSSSADVQSTGILICCVGRLSCDYAQNYLLSSESKVSCTISSKCASKVLPPYVDKGKSEEVELTQIYTQSKMDRNVLLHVKELAAGAEMQWARKVLDLTKPGTVVVLSSKPHLEHLSSTRCAPPFLRFLSSSSWSDDCLPDCPLLDAPNFVKGETGALLTLCEYKKIQGLALVCYHSQSEYIEAVKSFHCQGLTQTYLKPSREHMPSDLELARNIHRDSVNLASIFT